jgi:protein-disulfide isomerase
VPLLPKPIAFPYFPVLYVSFAFSTFLLKEKEFYLMKRFLLGFFAMIFLASLGCSGEKSSATSRSNAPTVPAAPLTEGLAQGTKGNVLAELNGQPITEQEVLDKIKPRLARIENMLFDIKHDAVDQIIEDRLLEAEAKKRNISVQDLLKSEVEDKVGEVTDKEVEDFYNANKARVGNRTLEDMKVPITNQIKGRKGSVYRANLIDRLTAKANIEVYLERPKVEVAVGNSPSKGPDNAPVTVIEFTDYQCPFCGKARPTVNELINTYKNDVHYVVRNFPLDFHPFAKKAAVAALCADEQKKYWDYSQKLWQNQTALDVASLKKYAADIKLDTKKFDDCLDNDKTLATVNQDQQDGIKAGVSGTPSFFINGQGLTGAQPIEAFKKIIDQELKEVKRKKG